MYGEVGCQFPVAGRGFKHELAIAGAFGEPLFSPLSPDPTSQRDMLLRPKGDNSKAFGKMPGLEKVTNK